MHITFVYMCVLVYVYICTCVCICVCVCVCVCVMMMNRTMHSKRNRSLHPWIAHQKKNINIMGNTVKAAADWRARLHAMQADPRARCAHAPRSSISWKSGP